MICVVIDAAGVVDAVEGVAPIRMTGTTTGGRYGTRVQVRDGGLTAPALTTDTEWDLKTGDGTGVPAMFQNNTFHILSFPWNNNH